MTHTTKHTPGPWTVSAGRTIETPSGQFYLTYNMDKHGNPLFRSFVELDSNAALIAAAPAMYEALKDLIGDLGDLHGGSIAELQCHWCGRDYEDEEAGGLCTSDDCPGYIARQAIAQAEGRHPRKEETCK